MKYLVDQAFNRLKTASPPSPSLIALVAAQLPFLVASEQNAFITLLARVIGEPQQRMQALRAVRLLPQLAPQQREQVVQALGDAEALEPDVDARIALLTTAKKVALSRGNARKVLKERLADLESRSGDDQVVFRRVTGDETEPAEPPPVDESAAETPNP